VTHAIDDRASVLRKPTISRPRVTLWDDHSLATCDRNWGESVPDRWLELLLSRPSRALVRNVDTRWGMLEAGDAVLPVTINNAEYDNSYVCSPYTASAVYPRSAVEKIPGRILPAALRALLHSAGPMLRAARINQVVCVNNWLVSTNLYPRIQLDLIPEITRRLVERFPSHAITMRSLNYVTNPELCEVLVRTGYLLAPCRQIYFFDGRDGEHLRKPNIRYDQRLLETTKYQIAPHELLQTSDAARIEHLYRMLYVERYSPHNPQITIELIHELQSRRLLRMWGLRSESGRLDGIVGVFDRDGVMTVPLLGYDTTLPIKLGLYRMLMAIAMGEAVRRGLLLNFSSGASYFKRLRGGEPCLEYTAVYCRHLSWPRQAVWKALAMAQRHLGTRILNKFDL
jgi:hypothetical protein